MAEKDSGARSGLAALASSIVPGWGQMIVGHHRLGRALLFVDGLLLVAVLVAIFFFQADLVRASVTPAALLVILGANFAVLVYRGLATLEAWRSGLGRGWMAWVGLGVAALVVLAPHFMVGSLALTQYDLIESVFADGEPLAVATTTAAPIATIAETGTTGSTGPSETSATTTLPPTTTTTTVPRIWDGKDRLNIMLLGSDAGVGRTGTRTDTIILVSIEPETGNVAMFSVPRNLTFAPLPAGMGLWDCQCFPDIITHLWANGEWYPDAFPGPQEPSINALKGSLGLLFDVDVHYYAKVDLEGFVGVVDALGGVTIDVPETLVDETYPSEDGSSQYVAIEAGTQHLDGHLALAYARIRRHSGDFARMHRQRCVLGALVSQTGALDVLSGFGKLASAVKENVTTDIPANRLGDFVELLPTIDTENVATLRITRYNYGVGGNNPGEQRYDLDQIRTDAHLLMGDPTLALETLDGVGFDDTCEESFD